MRLIKLPAVAHKGTAEFFVLLSAGGKVEGVKFISGSEELRSASHALAAAHYDLALPDAGGERIVRRGVLTCSEVTKRCDFVLYTPAMVGSVN